MLAHGNLHYKNTYIWEGNMERIKRQWTQEKVGLSVLDCFFSVHSKHDPARPTTLISSQCVGKVKVFNVFYWEEKLLAYCTPVIGLGYHGAGAVEGQWEGLHPTVNTDRLLMVILVA